MTDAKDKEPRRRLVVTRLSDVKTKGDPYAKLHDHPLPAPCRLDCPGYGHRGDE